MPISSSKEIQDSSKVENPVLAPIARVVKLATEDFCESLRQPTPQGSGLTELANQIIRQRMENPEQSPSGQEIDARLTLEARKGEALKKLTDRKSELNSHPAVQARIQEEMTKDPTLTPESAFDRVFDSMRFAVINLARSINLSLSES